ncbi:MAG: DUF47 family protein [Vallitaleaceae bacterium]|nr:DUF47 family protein [Vallitaleaceae bacterium]
MFFSKGKVVVDLVDEHLRAVKNCYDTYVVAMEAFLDGCQREQLADYNHQLNQLETEADLIRHKIIKKMLDGGLLVDSRKSLMRIIEGADTVADKSEGIVNMVYQEHFEVLSMMIDPIERMNLITKQQLDLLVDAIEKIIYKYDPDQLFETIRTIETLESDVDAIQSSLLDQLFQSDIELSVKLHYKQLFNDISSISDLIEDISDSIEIIMLTRKV